MAESRSMRSWRGIASLVFLALIVAALAHYAGGDTTTTRHDLLAPESGRPREELAPHGCVACHPEVGEPVRPAWGEFRAAEATPLDMPVTGSSRMCLKCHDGSIAPGPGRRGGAAVSRSANNAGGYLGATLSGGHPVSFVFDDTLARKHNKRYTLPLALPSTLKDAQVKLDGEGRMQCTTCHDPHSDANVDKGRAPHFYVKPGWNETCLVCHKAKDSKGEGFLKSVHGNARVVPGLCAACHEAHGAPGTALMPKSSRPVCFRCHGDRRDRDRLRGLGLIARHARPPAVLRDFRKTSRHPVPMVASGMQPSARQGRRLDPDKVYCESCHDPHQVAKQDRSWALRRAWPKKLRDARGEQTIEAKLCLRCHGSRGRRRRLQVDVGRRVDPANPSFHPILARGRGSNVPSLIRPLTERSLISCTDCHGSDERAGPRGPHGSVHEPILRSHFNRRNGQKETPRQYALCYRCHSRSVVLSSRSFNSHYLHVVSVGNSCRVCHDVHGSRQYGRLISFDEAVVFPNSRGQREWRSRGVLKGSCSLRCHGYNHTDTDY